MTSELGAQHTLAFVRSHVTAGGSILDVGCGNGALAKLLDSSGFQTIGVDYNQDAVDEARKNGVTAEYANFLEYDPGKQFDAVVLCRSLHHIHPVEKTVQKTFALLRSGGVILVDDFGAELMDAKSVNWFYGFRAFLAAGRTLKGRGPKLDHGEIPADPTTSWHNHHFVDHHVAELKAMLDSLNKHFERIEEVRLPFLYRYFLDDVTDQEAELIYQWEVSLCNTGGLVPIGVRFVGRKA